MTLFIALAALCISVFMVVLVLTVPAPHVPPASEEEWNNAVRSLRKEWDSWRVNRAQEFQFHSDHVDRRITELRDHLRNHISADHLHEGRGNDDDR